MDGPPLPMIFEVIARARRQPGGAMAEPLPPITSFADLPLDLQLALSLAEIGLRAMPSDVHASMALHYVLSMDRTIRRAENPWHAVRTQLNYILVNARRWRGEPAKQAKAVFRRYLKNIEERK